jgi:hypothetical protein
VMTEAEWLTVPEPRALLWSLRPGWTDRKLRLFGCACVRRVWSLLDAKARAAVELAERYADRLVTDTALLSAREELALEVNGPVGRDLPRPMAARAAACLLYTNDEAYDERAAYDWLVEEGAADFSADAIEDRAGERAVQAMLIRDIFGNPFRQRPVDSIRMPPAVLSLARSIYDDQTFDRMPELADAIEGVGLEDVDVLAHCRELGPHVRGCWVIDLILGKS